MAYKDEYEVARLHLDAVERARLADEFGPDASVSVLLHPPLLRALGLKRKLRLRRSAWIAFHLLRRAKRLRGTPFDVFGYARVRRVERQLIGEYRKLMDRALRLLDGDAATAAAVQAVADLPDLVRGYEEIKLAASSASVTARSRRSSSSAASASARRRPREAVALQRPAVTCRGASCPAR